MCAGVSEGVVQLASRKPDTYAAKAFHWASESLRMQTSGTLDGFIDLALFNASGRHVGTHILTCGEARAFAAKLLGAADDVQANCLFDRDRLLVPGRAE